MPAVEIPLNDWPHADRFRMFQTYARPHFAITSRLDATHLMRRKTEGVSVYRACLYAIGAGIHAVPELRLRMRDGRVFQHDDTQLSMTVPREDGSYGFAYLPFQPEFERFDQQAQQLIEAARIGTSFEAHHGADQAVAYLSCLPWLDFTAIDNALPGPEDCIPRVSWGKIVPEGGCFAMAMAVQVHHALVDGLHLGRYFEQVQTALNKI